MFYDLNAVIYTYYMHVNHITVTNYFSREADKSNGKDDVALIQF